MSTHTLSEKGWRRPSTHRRARNALVQLGRFHFWVLIGTIAGMLGLVVLMFVASRASL